MVLITLPPPHLYFSLTPIKADPPPPLNPENGPLKNSGKGGGALLEGGGSYVEGGLPLLFQRHQNCD